MKFLIFVPVQTSFLQYRKLSCKKDLLKAKLVETNYSLNTLNNVICLVTSYRLFVLSANLKLALKTNNLYEVSIGSLIAQTCFKVFLFYYKPYTF